MYANNLEMPVTLYRSTDDDAPALTKGNLSLILKACLVTGYGNKPGAGWTMPYEDAAASKRVIAPAKSGELDSYLRVADQSGQSRVAAYRQMSDIDNGEAILELATPYKHGQSKQWSGRWVVVASARSVIVWVEGGYDSPGRNGMMLYYGDTTSTDNGSRALILAHSGGSYNDGSHGSMFQYRDAKASAAAKSYRDDTGAQAQDFFSLFTPPRETAGEYVAPVLLQRGERLYAVPGVYTNTRAADNLTVIDDEGAQYIVLHSYGWKDLNKSFARLVVRTDKWRY
ncbi:hypothetical protein [Cardiobacterium hominis]|uniref:hypothetical protein n=1 Tax=Cardiobacterium hominis TaxID=2718 RepID=UPI0028D85C3F|nr:hypothetical protein [Cardiobacterium hominis]